MIALTFLVAAAGVVCQSRAAFEVASIKAHPDPIAFSSDAEIQGTMASATDLRRDD